MMQKTNTLVMCHICHMLKLVRNTFGNKGVIYDSDGGEIKWDHLVQLNNYQISQKLHAANKLRTPHIRFYGNKMKVKIAAQTLSKSVAKSLLLCKGKYFVINENLDPTIKFIEMFNDLFDSLNSRMFYAAPFAKPISDETKDAHFNLFDKAEKYINGLQIKDPNERNLKKVSLTKSTCRTGFVGFLVGINGVRNMYERHIVTKEMRFLMTYKLSQDHIENLFSVIRRRGVCNDNPNCMQFKTRQDKR